MMERKFNSVEVAAPAQIVDVVLTDEQILKAAAEIYVENPTAFLGQIVSYATVAELDSGADSGLNLH
jgi:7-keto-8-aminopelargonate synthetase-like enzyme